ncbi:MAG TPA: long-chain fatty acid--CoA ligase [Kutzneria sp.]|nr:long-chain fatty acid--CoA ligase [Kutzneria sp.]
MAFNLATILREAARSHPDKAALIVGGRPMTYAELAAACDRVAAGLLRAGIAPGDVVAVQLPNSVQFVVAYFAALRIGAVVVPMNPLYRADEIAHILRDSGARMLITWLGTAEEAEKASAAVDLTDMVVVAPPGTVVPPSYQDFETLYGPPGGVDVPVHQTDPGDTAVIVYTAGTTGRPKGAELTHFQLYMNADTPGRLFGIRDDDVVLVVLPLFHVFALSSILNLCVRFAATMSLLPRFEPGAALAAVHRDRVTVFEGVPTMYVALLEHPEAGRYDLSSLRVAVSGGAPIPAEVLDEFERRFGVVVLEGYGMSETASTTTFNVSAQDRRAYSVGRPIWGVEVEVWDERGVPVPTGREHVGELMVRGVNVMRGYHGDPEATARAFTRGWFHTGDLGYQDKDGFFFVVDRKKDLIIRGGYNVYPREVEDVLYTHPSVAEAAVVGIPDHRLGQSVKAFVALRPGRTATDTELMHHAKERLAAYKCPQAVEFRAALPKNAAGKIVKRELEPWTG